MNMKKQKLQKLNLHCKQPKYTVIPIWTTYSATNDFQNILSNIHWNKFFRPDTGSRKVVSGVLFRPGSMRVFMYPGRVCNSQVGTLMTGAVRIHLKFELSF